ncbi:MAG: translation initiation factor Sui1 [Chromatocurvus sp.]
MARNSSRPVYSTDRGRLCPACREPVNNCRCRSSTAARPAADGIVRLHRESKGRGGKAVTIIRGLPLEEAELKALAKQLKQRCGVGGAVKDGAVEIQGDQRDTLKKLLVDAGYRVKIAGG